MSDGRAATHEGVRLDRLSGGDALFLDVESPVTRLFVAVGLVFEAGPLRGPSGALDFGRIRRRIERRLSGLPRYRSRLARSPLEGRPIWVADEDFDLDRHVRLETWTGDDGPDRAELARRCGEWAAEDLDRRHPLWEIRVIDGIGPDRFAMLVKAHHCMVDGIAGIEILRSLLDVEPHAGEPDEEENPEPAPRPPGPFGLAMLEAMDRADATSRLARDALGALRTPRRLLQDGLDRLRGLARAEWFELHPASDSPLNHPLSGARRCAWWELEIERVEEIRRVRGGTLNDVAVAILALALTRILSERGLSRAAQRALDLRVTCPVDTRSRGRSSGAANQISMIVAPLPVGEDDPCVVLDRVRESLAEAKDSHMVEALDAVLRLADWVPRGVSRRLARLALRARFANVVLTNVPGPPVPLHLLESRLISAHPIVPLMPGHALCVAVLSYSGRLHWGLNADAWVFPDLTRCTDAIEEGFRTLHAAATAGRTPRERA